MYDIFEYFRVCIPYFKSSDGIWHVLAMKEGVYNEKGERDKMILSENSVPLLCLK